MRRAPASMAAAAVAASASLLCGARAGGLGPENPFYAPSMLPFHAPPFDRIKDEDYQPAIEAGMAQQIVEIERITDEAAPPTFENTLIAYQRSGRLLNRARAAFSAVSQANTNPTLQDAKTALAPKIAAHEDAIYLNQKLFDRVSAIYRQRATLKLDAESLRLVEIIYDEFVHAGASLSDSDKSQLKKLNEEASTLSNDFSNKLLEATKNAAYT